MADTIIPISGSKTYQRENYHRNSAQFLQGLSPSQSLKNCTTTCQKTDIIPILPLRTAFADLAGELKGQQQYPDSLHSLARAKDLKERKGYTMRSLRKGYIYIYDEKYNIWSVFGHTPATNPKKHGQFDKLEWAGETADSDWLEVSEDRGLSACYVPTSVQYVWVAFDQHRWSHDTFKKAHTDKDQFRKKNMTKIDLIAFGAAENPPINKDKNAISISDIEKVSEEFAAGKELKKTMKSVINGNHQATTPQAAIQAIIQPDDESTSESPLAITQPIADWMMLSAENFLPHYLEDLKNDHLLWKNKVAGKPAVIRVDDPLGVVEEINTAHVNSNLIIKSYSDSVAAPITSASYIDILLKTAQRELESGNPGRVKRKAYGDWLKAVDPAYKNYVPRESREDKSPNIVEKNLDQLGRVAENAVRSWRAYLDYSNKNKDQPGALGAIFRRFNRNTVKAEEIGGLIESLATSVRGMSSSQQGHEAVATSGLGADTDMTNTIAAGFQDLSAALSGAANIQSINNALKRSEALADLTMDMAAPFVLAATKFKREHFIQETITHLIMGVRGKRSKTTLVDIDLAKLKHEVDQALSRKRKGWDQTTQTKSQQVHRNTTPKKFRFTTNFTQLDQTISLSTRERFNKLNQLGNLGAGLSVFTNLYIITILATTPRANSRKYGKVERAANDPGLLLALSAVETVGMATSVYLNRSGKIAVNRQLSLTGEMAPRQMKKFLKPSSVDGILTKVLKQQKIALPAPTLIKSTAVTEKLSVKIASRVTIVAGAILAALDFSKAYQAFLNDDYYGAIGNGLIAVGSAAAAATFYVATISAATAGVSSTTVFGLPVAVVAGIAAAAATVVGLVLLYFADGPTETILKHSFWGKADTYDYWDKGRGEILIAARSLATTADLPSSDHPKTYIDAQFYILRNPDNFKSLNSDVDSLAQALQREEQEFAEIFYMPAPANLSRAYTNAELKDNTNNKPPIIVNTLSKPYANHIDVVRKPFALQLPGYVPHSELEAEFLVEVFTSDFFGTAYIDRHFNRHPDQKGYECVHFPVTDQVFANFSSTSTHHYILEGVVEVKKEDVSSRPESFTKWDLGLGALIMKRGWKYHPHSGLKLPRVYHDRASISNFWTDGGWDKSTLGAKKEMIIDSQYTPKAT